MKTTEERLQENINKSNEIHNFKYNYSLIENYANKIVFISKKELLYAIYNKIKN